MRTSKRLAIAVLILAGFVIGLEVGHDAGVPGVPSVVSEAQAVVGRPLTPVSVAGVSRRTSRRAVRRCAAGVTC